MRNLSRFLENPFDDKGISIGELFACATDHAGRMAGNNPGGELTARITATNSAIALVNDTYTDDETKLAIRKARKLAKDNYRVELRGELGKVAAAVIAVFGEGTTQYLQCFPHGRSIFNSCRDDQLAAQIQVVINGVTANQAQLGAPLVAQATALKTTWEGIYTASEESTVAKITTREEKRLARENLQLMLFLNLLKIAEMFPRQPEKLALYFQQSLLENPAPSPEDPPPPEE